MPWKFDGSEPIYLQIADEVIMRMISGQYAPGSKLPSVRELAVEAGVNPNTMQKALGYLEMKQLVHSERTSGRFVTEDQKMLDSLRQEMCARYISACVRQLKRIGISDRELEEALKKEMEKENGNC